MLKHSLIGAVALSALAPMAFAERGSDGNISLIYWQAPSTLNPYLSGGTKDLEAASLILEPLARYDENGSMVPYLATEIPTVANGGVSQDLTSITWSIKSGIKWSDGSAFTAHDVKFTADYCMDPAGGCAYLTNFENVSNVEVIDDLTVKVNFETSQPNPYLPFIGYTSPILQKAQFENCMGAKAQECTAENFGPIGTGPFVSVDFRPNDVIQMIANENYRDQNKPAFASLTLKGGGDAAAAGRAVMETGEFDYAWNLQLAPEVLAKMEEGGKGRVVAGFGALVERLEINLTNPSSSLDAETRSTREAAHPYLSDVRVRKALSLAIDRDLLVEIGYGSAGAPTCNLVPSPAIYASDNTECLTQDIDAANALLDEAGWLRGADGIRQKDGVRMSMLYQTSTNAVRQDFQALIKEWWSMIGVETELRNLNASVFFGSDPGSPDTYQKFYADIQMYASGFSGTDPQSYLGGYKCGLEPRPANQWNGENINRFCDPEYDKLIQELSTTGDLDKRAELIKTMNDILTKDGHISIPLVWRGSVSGVASSIEGVLLNPWDSELWNIADWHRAD